MLLCGYVLLFNLMESLKSCPANKSMVPAPELHLTRWENFLQLSPDNQFRLRKHNDVLTESC